MVPEQHSGQIPELVRMPCISWGIGQRDGGHQVLVHSGAGAQPAHTHTADTQAPRLPPAAQLAAPQQQLVREPAGQQAGQHHHCGQHPAAGLEAEGAAQHAGPQDA